MNTERCQWLLQGSIETCSKPHTKNGPYCRLHAYRKNQGIGLVPCKSCGVGINTFNNGCGYCVKCGRDTI